MENVHKNKPEYVGNKALIFIKERNWVKLDSMRMAPMPFSPPENFEIYKNIAGRIYLMTTNVHQSLQWNLKILERESEYQAMDLEKVYLNISFLFSQQQEMATAQEYLEKAANFTRQINDSNQVILE